MGPQTSPNPHKERNSKTETVGEGSFWYLPGVCGWDLRNNFCLGRPPGFFWWRRGWGVFILGIHPRKLTWIPKMMIWKRWLLLWPSLVSMLNFWGVSFMIIWGTTILDSPLYHQLVGTCAYHNHGFVVWGDSFKDWYQHVMNWVMTVMFFGFATWAC